MEHVVDGLIDACVCHSKRNQIYDMNISLQDNSLSREFQTKWRNKLRADRETSIRIELSYVLVTMTQEELLGRRRRIAEVLHRFVSWALAVLRYTGIGY